MQHFRRSQHVRVDPRALPDDEPCEGTIIRLSPDRRVAIIRIDDETELLIETQFLKLIRENL